MGTTPRLAIPYVENADTVAAYPTADKSQATRVEGVWFPGAWVTVTPVGSGTLRYLQVGSMIIVDINVATTIANNAQVVLSASPLPAAIRPLADAKAAGICNDVVAYLWVDPTGAVKARQWSGANKSNAMGTVIYPLF